MKSFFDIVENTAETKFNQIFRMDLPLLSDVTPDNIEIALREMVGYINDQQEHGTKGARFFGNDIIRQLPKDTTYYCNRFSIDGRFIEDAFTGKREFATTITVELGIK